MIDEVGVISYKEPLSIINELLSRPTCTLESLLTDNTFVIELTNSNTKLLELYFVI